MAKRRTIKINIPQFEEWFSTLCIKRKDFEDTVGFTCLYSNTITRGTMSLPAYTSMRNAYNLPDGVFVDCENENPTVETNNENKDICDELKKTNQLLQSLLDFIREELR